MTSNYETVIGICMMLFTDGSVHNQSKIGWGAYLLIDSESQKIEFLKNQVVTKRFLNTSSTKLEIQTLIWALEDIRIDSSKLKIYTDSQNIVRLPQRRFKLEKSNFCTKKNKLLKNHAIYKVFFNKIASIDCSFIKLEGHKKSNLKDKIDRIFSLVDQSARNSIRNCEPKNS